MYVCVFYAFDHYARMRLVFSKIERSRGETSTNLYKLCNNMSWECTARLSVCVCMEMLEIQSIHCTITREEGCVISPRRIGTDHRGRDSVTVSRLINHPGKRDDVMTESAGLYDFRRKRINQLCFSLSLAFIHASRRSALNFIIEWSDIIASLHSRQSRAFQSTGIFSSGNWNNQTIKIKLWSRPCNHK